MERFCGEISFQHKPRFKGNSDVKIVETFVPYGLPIQRRPGVKCATTQRAVNETQQCMNLDAFDHSQEEL